MRAPLAIAWLAALATPASARPDPAPAEQVRVVSTHADSISVTIYRDLFALITETRTVDLPAVPITLVFDGVVETLLPQSALVADTGRTLAEANFDFARLTPAGLLRNSIGREVMLTRTHRATGRVRQVAATVVAADTHGVVFRSADGQEAFDCSGLPEQLTVDSGALGTHSKPTLSVRLAAGTPGRRQVRVSYLAQGFAWSADYIGEVAPDAQHMSLVGWLTLRNLTGANLSGAQVQLVAGKLNLLDAQSERGTSTHGNTQWVASDADLERRRAWRLEEMLEEFADEPPAEIFHHCYPLGTTSMQPTMDAMSAEDIGNFPDANVGESMQRIAVSEEIVVTGFRASLAARENLADYQLYRVPAPTDLLARQTKQVAFLAKPKVKIERFYGVRIASNEGLPGDFDGFMPASIRLGWRNRASDGLGEPLPAGLFRMLETHAGRAVFAGDARLADSAVDAPVEIVLGRANDVGLQMHRGRPPEPGPLARLTHRAYLPTDLRIVNPRAVPIVFEVRQGPLGEFVSTRVKGASRAPGRKAGDYVWRIEVPAACDASLHYEVGGRVADDD